MSGGTLFPAIRPVTQHSQRPAGGSPTTTERHTSSVGTLPTVKQSERPAVGEPVRFPNVLKTHMFPKVVVSARFDGADIEDVIAVGQARKIRSEARVLAERGMSLSPIKLEGAYKAFDYDADALTVFYNELSRLHKAAGHPKNPQNVILKNALMIPTNRGVVASLFSNMSQQDAFASVGTLMQVHNPLHVAKQCVELVKENRWKPMAFMVNLASQNSDLPKAVATVGAVLEDSGELSLPDSTDAFSPILSHIPESVHDAFLAKWERVFDALGAQLRP